MKLYHGTKTDIKIGETLNVCDAIKKSAGAYDETIAKLEEKKPDACPSRSAALFATDSVAKAYIYAKSQFKNAPKIYVYEVEMIEYCVAPMCIVHQIKNRLESIMSYEALINEYWNPNEKWNFNEFYGPTFTILNQCTIPSESDLYLEGIKYENDVIKAEKL